MDFFKSMLSEAPEPENMDNHRNSTPERNPNHQQTERAEVEHSNLNSTSSGDVSGDTDGGGGLWSFGDLVKTLTTRSESVLETYRRDLKEFGSGLRKESDLFREVANRAVKELPTSIEIGASPIDGVVKSTVDIISQGKDVLLEPSDVDDSGTLESVQNSKMYNRFGAQMNAIQTDARTYCDDPDDLDDYNKWKLGFVLSDREEEIENLIGENGSVEAIYRKIVPNQVDDASFWCRYFFRVYKLKQQEEMRAHLVRRSLTVHDEEELSWDVDDDDDEGTDSPEIETKHSSNAVENDNMNNNVRVLKTDQNHEKCDNAGKDCVDDKSNLGELRLSDGDVSESKVVLVPKADEKLDCNMNSGQDLQEDEDLEWDEIGDTGDDDEKHVSRGETAVKGELFKRVKVAEDDEDLSWDIEDDDEPLKTSNRR